MAVHSDRPAWTDDRLDDLQQTMRDGFARNDEGFRSVNRRIDQLDSKLEARFVAQDARFEGRFEAQDAKFGARFDAQDAKFEAQDSKFEARFEAQDAKFEARFDAQDARFDRIDDRFDALQRTMILAMLGIIGTMMVGFATAILTST